MNGGGPLAKYIYCFAMKVYVNFFEKFNSYNGVMEI